MLYANALPKKINFKTFFKYAIFLILPILLESFIISSINFVDNFMISGLENKTLALRALFIVNKIFLFGNILVVGICTLGDIFFAQYIGQKNKAKIEEVIKIKIWFSLLFTTVFVTILFFLNEQFILFFTNDVNVVTLAQKYLFIILPSSFLVTISYVMVSNLRIIKKVKAPLLISSLALVCNIFLDWIFIYQLNLGVQGSAWATLVVRAIETALLFVFIKLNWAELGINFKKFFHLDFVLIKKILARSLLLVGFFIALSGLLLRTALFTNLTDEHASTASSIAFVFITISWAIFPVLNITIKIFVSPALGQDDMKKAQKLSRLLLAVNGIVVGFLMALLLFLAFVVLRWLNLEIKTLKYAQQIMLIYALTFPLFVWPAYVTGLLQAGGYTLVTLFRNSWMLVVLYPLAYLLFKYSDLSFIYIHLIIQLTWIIPTLIAIPLFHSKIWLKRIVEKKVTN